MHDTGFVASATTVVPVFRHTGLIYCSVFFFTAQHLLTVYCWGFVFPTLCLVLPTLLCFTSKFCVFHACGSHKHLLLCLPTYAGNVSESTVHGTTHEISEIKQGTACTCYLDVRAAKTIAICPSSSSPSFTIYDTSCHGTFIASIDDRRSATSARRNAIGAARELKSSAQITAE